MMPSRPIPIDPAIKALCDRVILPALLERFRVEMTAKPSLETLVRAEVSITSVHA